MSKTPTTDSTSADSSKFRSLMKDESNANRKLTGSMLRERNARNSPTSEDFQLKNGSVTTGTEESMPCCRNLRAKSESKQT
mmetsp:Transcript_7102/g.18157  ORF Transcript_7102/g.18157 Transcript_7102/m.18157 type:complete len:81 (+) Transcript_7102:465-707(+)